MPSNDEREMLLNAIKETMGIKSIPDHAMRKEEMKAKLREEGYLFSDHHFSETLIGLVAEGKVKKRRSGRQTYYWFVEETN